MPIPRTDWLASLYAAIASAGWQDAVKLRIHKDSLRQLDLAAAEWKAAGRFISMGGKLTNCNVPACSAGVCPP
jgi:hypothetical protein